MPSPDRATYPSGTPDERALFVRWLAFLRGSVAGKLDGLTEEQARWTPDGALTSVLGVVNHLTHVEWRWIDGGFRGVEVSRNEDEFTPGPELSVAAALAAYADRAAATEAAVRAIPSMTEPCQLEGCREEGIDLRWVLVHLINETARHAGHADATRELLDGSTGV